MSDVREVIILGAGPAGYTAALYTARANLSPLVLTGTQLGGQLSITSDIENFPGTGGGVAGPELMAKMQQQAESFGAELVFDIATDVDFESSPYVVKTASAEYGARSVIIATGSSPRMLGLESEQKHFGRGVSTCATCDGAFFRDKVVGVVGGGDSAVEEGTFLTRFASKVYIIHRRDQLRASVIMQKRAFENPKVEMVWDSVVTDVLGEENVTGVRVRNVKSDEETELALDGLFIAIGHIPNTQLFEGKLELDDQGYLVTDELQRTSVPGVFAAGDVQDHVFRQAITAAGTGCAAAISCERYLAELE